MKSKIKKLITIALATTMLLGMTLTVNAHSTATTTCKYCGLAGPVKHIKCYEHECEWYCQKCYIYFRK